MFDHPWTAIGSCSYETSTTPPAVLCKRGACAAEVGQGTVALLSNVSGNMFVHTHSPYHISSRYSTHQCRTESQSSLSIQRQCSYTNTTSPQIGHFSNHVSLPLILAWSQLGRPTRACGT